jgi:transposase
MFLPRGFTGSFRAASHIAFDPRDHDDEVRRDDTMRRPATIPGIGPITAATIQALVPDLGAFTSGRHLAAWIGFPQTTVRYQMLD